MNKHCYRIIFSRTHGELRVVPDIARSCSTQPGQSRAPGAPRFWVTVRRAVWLLSLSLFSAPLFAAGIIADKNAVSGQRPDVINTQNGLPQVNITAPNQAGISHNQYSQFDVDQKGAVLNNSAVMTSTQLAGMIQGNPNLNPGKAPASVILNEVNSTNPSELRGYMEVAGGRAQVIVANPSGIVCNGCGTINAGRMTLTTGKPELNADGTLAGYQVEQGVIRVEGGGLNGDARQDTQYVDVLARAVEVNAGVWAKEKINVVAGRNHISADGKTVVASADNGSAKPELAIDMGQMGGMYSGQIQMVGTEAGVGVRNQGAQLQAGKTLTVSSSGRLIWQAGENGASTQAGGSVSLTADDAIEHAGNLYSGGTLNVQSRKGDIRQTGTIAAAGSIKLSAAGDIRNTGNLLAGSDANGTLTQEADLTLTSGGDVHSSGRLLTKKTASVSGKRIDLSQAQLAANQATLSTAEGGVALQNTKVDSRHLIVNTSGDVDARQAQIKAGDWDLTARNLFNQQAVWSQTEASESRFMLSGLLDNTAGAIEADSLKLYSGSLINQNGRLVALSHNAQQWSFTDAVDNDSGEMGSNGDLTLKAGSFGNHSGSVRSLSSLQIHSSGDADNTDGRLLAGKQLSIEASNFVNQKGVTGGEQVLLKSSHFDNQQGQVTGLLDVHIDSLNGVDNSLGSVVAGQALDILSTGNVENQGGTLQGDTRLSLAADNVSNANGKLLTGNKLSVHVNGALDNTAGELSGDALELSAQRLTNTNGKITGSTSAGVTTGDLLNSRGLVSAGQHLTLSAGGIFDNRGGEFSSDAVGITAGSIENAQGKILAGQNITLSAQGALNNTTGNIQAGSELNVSLSGNWNNQNGAAQGGSLVKISAWGLDNSQGRLQSGGALDLATTGDINNHAGKLTAQDQLSWHSAGPASLSNDGGSLQSGGDMTLQGENISNRQQGVILSQKKLSLDLGADLNNQGGQITGTGGTSLHAASFYNAQGSVNALDSLDMQLTQTLDNGSGRIFSQAAQTLRADTLSNNQGWIGSQGQWQASTSLFDNTSGSVQTGQSAQLKTVSLRNQQGVLQSADDLSLNISQDTDNRAGKISAQGQLRVSGSDEGETSGAINNAGGQWLAGEILKIAAQSVDNTQGGLLYSQKMLTLELTRDLNNQLGKIQSGDALSVAAQSVQNKDGALDSQQLLSLKILSELNNLGGSLRSEGDQEISAGSFNNQNGMTSSRGSLKVETPQLDNDSGTLISQGSAVFNVDSLNNTHGKIHSGNALSIAGEQITNAAGQIVSTKDLGLQAETLNNSGNGIISSQAGMTVDTTRLINRDGGSVLGTGPSTVTAREIDNTAGSLQSAGTLTLGGLSLLDNHQGRIKANGSLSINPLSHLFIRAASLPGLVLQNQNGEIQSGGILTASVQNFNNQGGILQSQQGMNLSLAQDYTHRAGETLSSNGTLTLSVAGTVTNLADWLLPGNLTLSATSIINPASIVARTLQLTTGSLLNTGRLDADKLSLSVDALDNNAAIMGDDVLVNGRIIDNHGSAAVIAATQSLDLQSRERTSNRDGALLYSSGRLHMSSGDLIENKASSIEADGDVTVEANRLDNLREGLVINREAEKSDYNQHLYNYYWRSYGENVNTDISTMAPTTQKLTYRDDASASSNPYGTLLNIDAAAKRAEVQVKNNKGQLVSLWVSYLALVPNADGSYAMTFYETRGPRQRSVPTPYQNTVWWNATDSEKIETWSPDRFIDIASAPYVTDYNNLRERTITGTVTRDQLISAGSGASLLSGGNMSLHISGQLQNDAGTISSNGNLTIDGTASVINRGYSVNERRQEVIVDHYDKGENHWYPTNNLDATTALTTFDGIISGHGNVSIAGAHIENTTVRQAQISAVTAALQAVDAEKAEWQRNPLAFSVDGNGSATGDTALASAMTSSAANASPLQRPLLPSELALTKLQQLGTVVTSVPNNGLFRQNPVAGSRYLVVTDERFTSQTRFISSDYLLSQVGYDPAAVHKRLGDGFYEQKLVRDQVLSLTGKQSVQGEDAMEQYQNLMNNGAKVAQDFHLIPGVALTPQQIASLQQDIVWLVSETVETAAGPETVWVPKVYLAQSTLRLTGDGALIAGANLQLSANSVSNAGNIIADKAMSIDAGQFSHQSGDIKAESINVQADSLNISTNLQDALRQATLAAGNISLSGNDIQLQGAKVDASKDLNVSARDNLVISAAKSSTVADLKIISGSMGNRTSDGLEDAGKRMATVSGEWQKALASELNAGGSMNLKAGQDITLQGSQAKAGSELNVQAGGNVKLLADKTTNNTHLEADSSTSSVSNTRSEDTALLSSLSGTAGVTMTAGKDLVAQGVQVYSTAGSIGVSAENVTIEAAQQSTQASDSEHTKKGKTEGQRSEETSRQTVTGSAFSAKEGITTVARAGDINVSGSSLRSDNGGIALSAKKDVLIGSATESESRYIEEQTRHSGMLNKNSTHTVQDDRVTTEKGSQLSGNTISINAGNDLTVQGSSVAGDTGVVLNAGHDLNILAATNTESTYSLSEKKKSGLTGGGLGLSYGKQSAMSERNNEQVTQSDARSLVGAGNGAVTMTAGNNALISGSDVVAGGQNGDISITAKNIAIVAGQDQVRDTANQESKSSGFGLSLNLTPLDTVRNLRDIMKNTSSVYDQVKQIGNEFGASAVDSPGPGLTYGRSGSKASQNSESVYQSGSALNASGNLTLKALGDADTSTGNILVGGSSLNAGGKATLDATRDINITSAADSQKAATSSSSKSWSATTSASLGALTRSAGGSPNNGSAGTNYGSKNSQMSGDSNILTQHTSSITAGSIDVTSHKGDIAITGSTLTGTTGVSLNAEQGNVSVVAGEDSQQTSASGSDHAIGDLGGDGYSGTVGVSHNSWKNASAGTQQNTVRSGIVSTLGDVTVNAAKDVNLQGADVFAGDSLSVNGENIHLDPAKDTHNASSSSESTKYGITGSVSGYAVSIAQAVDKAREANRNHDDPRLQAIYAAQAAMTALSSSAQSNAAIKVSVSATAGSSHQSQTQSSTQENGTVLGALNNVDLNAEKDITAQGVKITGNNVSLAAGGDVKLNSATDTSSLKSSSGGSQYGVGVGFGLGGSQNGFSISVSASQSSANANGSSVTHHNSEVTAGNNLSVSSGQDVILQGANLSGKHVDVDAGRNLLIRSEQDSASFKSQQSSSGANVSICVPPICAGSVVEGSANMSGSNLYNDFASVQQQSGIVAGEGGYDIYVGNHTQLDGAIIGSSASPDKNHLSTGTLGWTDIDNHANSGSSGYGFSVSGSYGNTASGDTDKTQQSSAANDKNKDDKKDPASDRNSLPVASLQQNKDSASSTTYSAISPGTIEIRNPDAQKQDVSQISHDTASAENALKDNFDAEKLQSNLDVQREMTALGQQVIETTYEKLKEQRKKEAQKELENDPTYKGKSDAEKQKAIADSDKKVEAQYGIGSLNQSAAQAVVGLFSALAGGNVSGSVAAGASPLVAQLVKYVSQNTDGGEPMRVLLHTLISGLIAKAQGGSVAGGAAGGFTTAMLGHNDELSKFIFGKNVNELTEDQKELLANIGTLAGAVSGGAIDGSTGAGSGAVTGRSEVENNTLSPGDFGKGFSDNAQAQSSLGISMLQKGASPDEIAAALAKAAEGDLPDGQNAAKGLITAWGNFFGMPLDLIMSNEQMTPEKAAEIISGGVPTSEAKLLQYVAAKAYITLAKSTTVKAETGNSLIYHENFGGHVIEKHVNKSDAELLARLQAEPRLSATSTFFDDAAADKAIGNAIADQSNKIKLNEWLSGDQTRLILTHEETFNVGRVMNQGDQSSHLSNQIILVIDKDSLMPNGYRIHTAYPK